MFLSRFHRPPFCDPCVSLSIKAISYTSCHYIQCIIKYLQRVNFIINEKKSNVKLQFTSILKHTVMDPTIQNSGIIFLLIKINVEPSETEREVSIDPERHYFRDIRERPTENSDVEYQFPDSVRTIYFFSFTYNLILSGSHLIVILGN